MNGHSETRVDESRKHDTRVDATLNKIYQVPGALVSLSSQIFSERVQQEFSSLGQV